MRAKKFVLRGIAFTVMFFTIYVFLFVYQLNASVRADYWVYNALQYKEYLAKNIQRKKIIIISGSNALFGINSQTIQDKTGYPVSNLATHAELDIDFLLYKLEDNIDEGDIVVMPLEFTYYSNTNKISDFFSNNMMSWGRGYLYQLPLEDFLRFMMSAEPGRVLSGVLQQIVTKGTNKKVLTEKEILRNLQSIWERDGIKWRGYSYKSLTEFGDISVDEPLKYQNKAKYLKEKLELSTYFLETYAKVDQLVKHNHGKLYLTYPATIRSDDLNFSMEQSRAKIDHLEEALKKHGINIQCNAALFNIDRIYFFDTYYHLNKYGALIRSENLAECLNELIQFQQYEKLSYDEAIRKTNSLQNKYMDLVIKP